MDIVLKSNLFYLGWGGALRLINAVLGNPD